MGDLFQFLVRTPAQPRAKFTSGGALTDLDGPAGGTCAVTLTKPDGTAGPAAGTVTHVATGVYAITVDGPVDPFYYDVAWSGTIGGRNVVQTTRAEFLGELLFTLPDLRAYKVAGAAPFADPVAWPDEQLMDARTATLAEFTEILRYSPVPRFAREVLNGNGRSQLTLAEAQRECAKLLSVTVNGVAQALGGYTLQPWGVLEATSGYNWGGIFTPGRANVAVEYVHGTPMPPGDAADVAMRRAAMRLVPGPAANASMVTTPEGSWSFDMAGQVTATGVTRHFGVPAIDSWLNRHRATGMVA